jgi:hypothetical protein
MDCVVSLAMTIARGAEPEPRRFSFTVFVDAIFTTLLEALFTKAFDVIARFCVRTCVWRSGRAD